MKRAPAQAVLFLCVLLFYFNNKNKAYGLMIRLMVGVLGLEPRTLRV